MDLFEVGFAKEFVFHNFSFRFHGSFTDLLLFNASSVPNQPKEKISDKIPVQGGGKKKYRLFFPFFASCKIAWSFFFFQRKKSGKIKRPCLTLKNAYRCKFALNSCFFALRVRLRNRNASEKDPPRKKETDPKRSGGVFCYNSSSYPPIPLYNGSYVF